MPDKLPQWLTALCVAALCAVPALGYAQCPPGTVPIRRDSAFARPFTSGAAAQDTTAGRDTTLRRHAVSRSDPKLAVYRTGGQHIPVVKEQGRLYVKKDRPNCGPAVAAGKGPVPTGTGTPVPTTPVAEQPTTPSDTPTPSTPSTPSTTPTPAVPTSTMPTTEQLLSPNERRGGLFGGLLFGAVAAAVLNHSGGASAIEGGTIGTGTTPGGGGTTPGGGGGTDTTSTGGGTTPGGGGTTPGGGGTDTTSSGGGGSGCTVNCGTPPGCTTNCGTTPGCTVNCGPPTPGCTVNCGPPSPGCTVNCGTPPTCTVNCGTPPPPSCTGICGTAETPVPEPATVLLVAGGLLTIGAGARRRRSTRHR